VVLGLPVDVVISIIIPIIGAPVSREGLFIRAGASRVGVIWRYWASAVRATSNMGDGALVSFVTPGVTETTEERFVAFLGVMTDLVTGFAACPGPLVLGALGANVAAVSAHGAEGVHVEDEGGGWMSGRGNGGRRAGCGVGVEGGRSGRGVVDSGSGVKEGGAYHALRCGVIGFFTDGTGGG
jgi:hypothetical protein